MGKVLQVASLALGLMAAGFSAQASAETKIAVINVPRIMQEIPQGKAVEAKLKSEFSSRISEMQRLETEGQNLAAKLKKDEAFMAADERTKLQRRLAELRTSDSDIALRHVWLFQPHFDAASDVPFEHICQRLYHHVGARLPMEQAVKMLLKPLALPHRMEHLIERPLTHLARRVMAA